MDTALDSLAPCLLREHSIDNDPLPPHLLLTLPATLCQHGAFRRVLHAKKATGSLEQALLRRGKRQVARFLLQYLRHRVLETRPLHLKSRAQALFDVLAALRLPRCALIELCV